MSASYSKYSKRIKIAAELDSSQSSEETCSSEFNSEDRFSCWDILDPNWLNNAKELEDVRIYVSREILDWIVDYINSTILDDTVRATVEEVYHHNQDGDVYLIKFYQHKPKSSSRSTRHHVEAIKHKLKSNMPWKTLPTYFLRKDSQFTDRNNRIRKELEEINVLNGFEATSLNVNWMHISSIVIYEFSDCLTMYQKYKIGSIFERDSNYAAPIFICHQFEWHHHDFIEVDKLVMDICVREWRLHDLLKDFRIEELLSLDLANKDYRDPYFNDNLDKYLDILLKRSLPQLTSDHNEKIQFPAYRLSEELVSYFVSRFYNKMCISDDQLAYYRGITKAYDITIMKSTKENEVDLRDNQPPPNALLKNMSHTIIYNISSYDYFSESLLRSLVNNNYNEFQTYSIRFDSEFNFIYDGELYISPYPPNDCNRTFGTKHINFELEHCIERNADKLASFVKFLIDFFRHSKILDTEISIKFTNCRLDDYTFLENIGNVIQYVRFREMNFVYGQLKVLSCALAQQINVDFENCNNMTDHDVMILLENIDFDHLGIDGTNSFTPLVCFMMAEHLMNKDGVNTIEGNRFVENMEDCNRNFYFDYDRVHFFRDGDKIVARNCNSKQIVDLNYFTDDIYEDKSFDPSNNIYKE